jgi:hypothetical protein
MKHRTQNHLFGLGTKSRKVHRMNRSIVRWVLFSILLLSFSAVSFGQVSVGISVRIGPPPLPVYAQPICPGPGYIWTPGYWAWSDDDGYYWVPGTWVVAPVGMLWTPGWWGWDDGFYRWHGGYWGPHVGFYGGINYGYGYTGNGFYGGDWRHDRFYYNRSVNNVSVTNVTNVYNRTVIVNDNRVAYNGGNGGVHMRPSPQQESYMRQAHTSELPMQRQHERAAMQNRQNFARENHGRPAVAATARPADFSRRAVVPARAAGGEWHPPAMSPREARVNPGAVNRGNPNNRGNDGFRSSNPPARGVPAANNRGGNNPRMNDNRPAPNRMNDRPAENRGNANRPAYRPNDNRGASQMNDRPNQNRQPDMRPNDRPNQNRQPDMRMNERPNQNRQPDMRMNDRPNQNRQPDVRTNDRPNQNRQPDRRMNESRPQNQPREMSRPPQSAPREAPRPAPAQRHDNGPPRGDHRGR